MTLTGAVEPPQLCELCGKPLGDGRPWMLGLDGTGAHHECLETFDVDDDERSPDV